MQHVRVCVCWGSETWAGSLHARTEGEQEPRSSELEAVKVLLFLGQDVPAPTKTIFFVGSFESIVWA